ncbi:A24 family peptidase [Sphingopyxis indica]|nr:prepilin peptidase [Sphingopyxis indica]
MTKRRGIMTDLLAFQVAFVAILLLATASDIHSLRIPNLLPALMILLFLAAWVWGFPFRDPIWSHLAHFALALAAGMALFHFRWFGGGDAKLYAAVALWFGLGDAVLLLLLTALTGALVVVVRMLFHIFRALAFDSGPPEHRRRLFERKIPYGIAIAAGGIVTLLQTYPWSPS